MESVGTLESPLASTYELSVRSIWILVKDLRHGKRVHPILFKYLAHSLITSSSAAHLSKWPARHSRRSLTFSLTRLHLAVEYLNSGPRPWSKKSSRRISESSVLRDEWNLERSINLSQNSSDTKYWDIEIRSLAASRFSIVSFWYPSLLINIIQNTLSASYQGRWTPS